VTAVEMDHDLPAVLADTLSPWRERFTLLEMDALDLHKLFKRGSDRRKAER